MSDSDEADVILADGELWKPPVEQLQKLSPGVTQYLSELEKLAELFSFFHPVSKNNVNM